jgi:biotin transport system ATP-binding protein
MTLPLTPSPNSPSGATGADKAGEVNDSGLRLLDVTLRRGANTVLRNISLSLSERRIGIIGDNGAGKSSLFRLLCALDAPQSGRVVWQGQDLHARGQRVAGVAGRIGMMFQNPDDQIIFPTVEEELALGLQPLGLGRATALERARGFLAQRSLSHWSARAISSLSQGQRQHVCWLSLLIAMPQTLLLDEPFASLDLPGQARLRQEIADAAPQILVSTHALNHVRDFARVIWLDQGKVRADGPGGDICAAYEADVAARAA